MNYRIFVTGKTEQESTAKAVKYLRDYFASHFDNEFDAIIYHDSPKGYYEFLGGDVFYCNHKEQMMIKLINVENKPLVVVIDSLDEFIDDKYFNMRMEEIINFQHVRFVFVGSNRCRSNKIINKYFEELSN